VPPPTAPGAAEIGQPQPADRVQQLKQQQQQQRQTKEEDSGESQRSEQTHMQACVSSTPQPEPEPGTGAAAAAAIDDAGVATTAAASEQQQPGKQEHQEASAQQDEQQQQQQDTQQQDKQQQDKQQQHQQDNRDWLRELLLIQQLRQQQALFEQFHNHKQRQQQQQQQSDAANHDQHPLRPGLSLRSANSGGADISGLLGGMRRPLLDVHLRQSGLGPAQPLGRAELRALGLEAADGSPPEKRRAMGADGGGAALAWADELLNEWGAVAGSLAMSPREQKRMARLLRERQRLAVEAPGPAFAGGTGRVRRAGFVDDDEEDEEDDEEEEGEDEEAAAAARAKAQAAAEARRQRPPRAPRPKRPAKPWQPKAEKDEPNWRGADPFRDFVAAAEDSLSKSAPKAWPRAHPSHATARFVVLLLLHAPGWPNWRVWEEWARAHPEGEVVLFVHMKAGVAMNPGMPGYESINRCRLKTSVRSEWGDVNLVQVRGGVGGSGEVRGLVGCLWYLLAVCVLSFIPAHAHSHNPSPPDPHTKTNAPNPHRPQPPPPHTHTAPQAQVDCMAEVLRRCPAAVHIAVASGHDIPVRTIAPALLPPGATLFGAYQFAEREQTTLKAATEEELRVTGGMGEREAAAWAEALTFHHQWMVVAREHAAALVALRKEIIQVGVVGWGWGGGGWGWGWV